MVQHVVDRAARIPGVTDLVVAVPDLEEDDRLVRALDAAGIPSVRGPAADVLHRFTIAAEITRADVIVRITADCPLLSPVIGGLVVAAFLEDRWDYASNTVERTFPRGMDVEAFSRAVLDEADRRATADDEREHVTPYIWRRPECYRIRSVRADVDRSDVRLTVDTEEDMRLVTAVHEALGPRDSLDLDRVLALLARRPDLTALNQHVRQRGPVR